ncbi:MAG: ABC transporter ATP-binding protein [Candidatus Omnitrophota bacterium]|jgi:ABC-2 type transport system ATP-binding protein|nr:MAG: ABC transporter ATP-binding protein [Candidatus Omnitrophota bacterium]
MTEMAITTKGLGKTYGKRWAVRNLDLEVPAGAVFGLLGPNGAGKSTTIQMLMGLLPQSGGSISILGLDPALDDVAVRRRVGYVPEVFGFYEWMRIDELIALVAAYHDNWNWTLCSELSAEFRLDGDATVKTLSKGMRAKLALLLSLAFEPDMLVLDEPTGGLDPAARRNYIETILAKFQETGKTIFVSSHLINEFSGLLDHVAFIKDGKLELATEVKTLHEQTKRARLVFDAPVPSDLRVGDALAVRVNGREALVTCRHYDPQRTQETLAETGAKNIIIEEMTLEDIFVDMVGS